MDGEQDEDHAEQLQLARLRVHVLSAVVAALDRRDDVSALIADSDNVAAARTSLAALLDTDETGANGVLQLHWSAFTRERHHHAREDLEQARSHVHSLESKDFRPGPDATRF